MPKHSFKDTLHLYIQNDGNTNSEITEVAFLIGSETERSVHAWLDLMLEDHPPFKSYCTHRCVGMSLKCQFFDSYVCDVICECTRCEVCDACLCCACVHVCSVQKQLVLYRNNHFLIELKACPVRWTPHLVLLTGLNLQLMTSQALGEILLLFPLYHVLGCISTQKHLLSVDGS